MTAPRQHPGHTNAPAVPTSEVLLAAARDLEVNGWVQLSPGMFAAGPHCALGAIGGASGLTPRWQMYLFEDVAKQPAALALADYLGVEVGEDGDGIYRWNDQKGRTADEVITALRAAALIEAAREQTEVGVSGAAAEAGVLS